MNRQHKIASIDEIFLEFKTSTGYQVKFQFDFDTTYGDLLSEMKLEVAHNNLIARSTDFQAGDEDEAQPMANFVEYFQRLSSQRQQSTLKRGREG
jgi:hypothetical protein